MMGQAPATDLELLVTEWLAALGRGDLEAAAGLLDPQVVWRGVHEDLLCTGRAQVLDMLRDALRRRPRVEALEVVSGEGGVMLGVRTAEGQLFNVFRLREGRIVAVEDRLDCADALLAAGAPAPEWR